MQQFKNFENMRNSGFHRDSVLKKIHIWLVKKGFNPTKVLLGGYIQVVKI